MPCYLFTYHAFGSWMPDHRRGFVRRRHGILAPSIKTANQYRDRMVHDAVVFDANMQRRLIDETLAAALTKNSAPTT